MRILNVTETYAPFFEFGGPPVKVRALSEGLALRGHQVNVLTADWGFEPRLSAPPEECAADRSPFGWRQTQNGVQAIYLPTWFRYRSVTWNPAVKRYCRARLQNFDIVHIFGLYDLLGPAVAAACREKNIPYVVEPIGMIIPIVRNLWMKRMYHRFLGNRIFSGAGAVVATSEQEVQDLLSARVPSSKIVLRRNGVETPALWPAHGKFRSDFGIPRESKLVLFLGRLSEKKSPELLLQAFAGLPQDSPSLSPVLAFAGPDDNGMVSRLSRLASNLGVDSRVKFCGPLFAADKWAAYRDADVFVLPSQNENFGNTAAEAVAAGTPVIVTENCGVAPLLQDLAALVVPYQKDALVHALSSILGDATLRDRLIAGCAEVTSRLGWEQPVVEMESLYSGLVASQR